MFTPIDIQNHTLKTTVRGYNKKETDEFLEQILASYEELYKENQEIKDKLNGLNEQVQYYKNMEDTLQKALLLAEKTSTETKEAAKSKADAMVNEAKVKAEAMVNEATTKSESMLKEAQTKADAIEKEADSYSEMTKAKANHQLEATKAHVRKLTQSYESYRLQFKKLAEAQIEMLDSDSYSIFAPDLEEMMEKNSSDLVAEEEKETAETSDTEYFQKETQKAHEILEETKEPVEETKMADEVEEDEIEVTEEVVSSTDQNREDLQDETTLETEEMVTKEVAATQEEEVPEETEGELEKTKDLGDGEKAWRDTTPKIEGFDHVEISKSVEPEKKEDSPFTFIDLE